MKNLFLIRNDFPMLKKRVYDHPLTYLDSAATTLKPQQVIDHISHVYSSEYGTVHRAVYQTSLETTAQYNKAREKIASFINAPFSEEIIFTRGTTDSLNIIADSLAVGVLQPGDCILISEMEHHSNIIPWQMAAKRSGATLKVIPITEAGELCLESLSSLLQKENVRIVALTHCSNLLGTINPIQKISKLLPEETLLIVDGAQSIPHMPIDVQELGCDIFCFSAHKMYGPTGIGILWGKKELLTKLPPTRGGSDMIDFVSYTESSWNYLPLKFEPGTPMIAQAIAFGKTIEYLEQIPLQELHAHEKALFSHMQSSLKNISGITVLGTAPDHAPLQSFHIQGAHPLDISSFLDLKGIAIRSGHLCCQPLLRKYNLSSALRISLGIYNTKEDIDYFLASLKEAYATIL